LYFLRTTQENLPAKGEINEDNWGLLVDSFSFFLWLKSKFLKFLR